MDFQLPPAVVQKAPAKNGALIQSYTTRLKEDIQSMCDNFDEIIRLSHVRERDKLYKIEQDNNEVQIRGANILRAAESLMKLISDLKDNMVINDFYNMNYEQYDSKQNIKRTVKEIDKKISRLWSDMIIDLQDLEEEYYMSPYPDLPGNRLGNNIST